MATRLDTRLGVVFRYLNSLLALLGLVFPPPAFVQGGILGATKSVRHSDLGSILPSRPSDASLDAMVLEEQFLIN